MLHLLQDDLDNPHKDSYGSPHPAHDSPYFKPGPHQNGAQDAYRDGLKYGSQVP